MTFSTEALPRNIRFIRTVRGITQDDLADRCDVSRNTINSYEAGSSTPGISVSLKLADSLGVSLNDLLETSYVERAKRRLLSE